MKYDKTYEWSFGTCSASQINRSEKCSKMQMTQMTHVLRWKVAFTLLQGRLPVSTFTCSVTGVAMKVGVIPST